MVMEQVTEYNNVTREVKIQVRILEYLENWNIVEQVTEYNNVTREVKIQVRILRELEVHGAGHRIQQCHTGDQNTGQNIKIIGRSWSKSQNTTMSHGRSKYRSEY